jgi:hypothetical protein
MWMRVVSADFAAQVGALKRRQYTHARTPPRNTLTDTNRERERHNTRVVYRAKCCSACADKPFDCLHVPENRGRLSASSLEISGFCSRFYQFSDIKYAPTFRIDLCC